MGKRYLDKLVKYMKDVYKIEKGISKLSDKRRNPIYDTGQVILPVLFGFMIRIQSFNELNNRIKSNDFKRLVSRKTKFPFIDTIRDTLKVINVKGIDDINVGIIKKSVENKVFRKGTIDGYSVAAIDGTKIFGSNKKSCKECLVTVKGKNTHYSHSAVFISTVGKKPRMVLDFELYKAGIDSPKKDEGELTVAKRLLEKVTSEHKNLIDIVVYDALACNSIWINHCNKCKVTPVVQVKKNNINSIKEIKSEINKEEITENWYDEDKKLEVKVYEKSLHMNNVDEPLRFIKFTKKKNDKKYSQILLITTSFEIPLKVLYKIISARWDIENSVFNNLKTHCALDRCFVHNINAIEAILYLMIIASNLMQLFINRRLKSAVKSQKELIRLIIKELYLLKENKECIFNTT
ncbi:transposase [Clostridium bowmanii]|uniref:transposase n=1 Tax=Clostridium bowmanii TaxID=132925 RepID=UPI001CD5E1E9|nr:transposase [Clostridium bowmanii]MCA1072495.1 transposase [Clostridium bowmanii]